VKLYQGSHTHQILMSQDRWLHDPAIVGNIATIANGREVKWTWDIDGKPVGLRQTRVAWSTDWERWLIMHGKRKLDVFVSTNILNWDKIPQLPPSYRAKGKGLNTEERKRYANRWKDFLTPEGLKGTGVAFEELWLGKNMVWDIDNTDLKVAYNDATQIYNYLIDANLNPLMVFSGNKGFHIWLSADQSAELAGVHLHDLVNRPDPLRDLGREYARTVADITFAATGEELPSLDKSPNYRQGVIRLPYSVNKGRIVWPMDDDDRKKLDGAEFSTADEVNQLLQPWESGEFRFRPANGCFRRVHEALR